jgi:hypothetical protein
VDSSCRDIAEGNKKTKEALVTCKIRFTCIDGRIQMEILGSRQHLRLPTLDSPSAFSHLRTLEI